MKKPEKIDIYKMKHGAVVSNTWWEEGYNKGLKVSEAYHNWDIKENYIRRDKLLSEDEIFDILDKKADEFDLRINVGQATNIAKAIAKANIIKVKEKI